MEKHISAVIVALILLSPLAALLAQKDTESADLSLDTQNYVLEFGTMGTDEDSSCGQMQESEILEEVATPVRYAITDYERDQIERMVASEGGYCPYEFQALVAECILNGAEKEGLRPTELFERGIMPTEEKIFCYYNPNHCDSAAHEAQRYVLTCCDCRFFAEWDDCE